MLNPAEAKEKTLKAVALRRLIERGWLTALLSLYILKRKEAKVRLLGVRDVSDLRTREEGSEGQTEAHRRRSAAEEGLRGPGEAHVLYY